MGCCASKGQLAKPVKRSAAAYGRPADEGELLAAEAYARSLAQAKAAGEARAAKGGGSSAAPQFEQSTDMLVMPYGEFKAQGRIMKSVKQWRDQALASGSLVVYEEGSDKIAIFVSHTWWDRDFKDATNDPEDMYDKGSPDYQADYPEEEREVEINFVEKKMVTYQRPKDQKWRVICAGVQRLVAQEGLKEEDVCLWLDWQSIYQDDKAEKLKGVKSLIQFAAMCPYMLVPTEESTLEGYAATYPELIPAYGGRGWCRLEYFVFSLVAEMQGRAVKLYAITLDGALNCYPEVKVLTEISMPSQGALSNPADQELVKGLEDTMIEAFGFAVVELACEAAGGGWADLGGKMLRPMHVGALGAAVERTQVAWLRLNGNQLGAAGAELLAAALQTNATTTALDLGGNDLGAVGCEAIAAVLPLTKITRLRLGDNQLCGVDLGGRGTYTTKALATLCEWLKGGAVTELVLGLNQLCGQRMGNGTYTSEGITMLCEALKGSAIASLNLKDNAIGSKEAAQLAELLSRTEIAELNLVENQLSEEAKGKIREAFKGDPADLQL